MRPALTLSHLLLSLQYVYISISCKRPSRLSHQRFSLQFIVQRIVELFGPSTSGREHGILRRASRTNLTMYIMCNYVSMLALRWRSTGQSARTARDRFIPAVPQSKLDPLVARVARSISGRRPTHLQWPSSGAGTVPNGMSQFLSSNMSSTKYLHNN